MNGDSEPNWDGDLFRLYHKRLGADSWQDDFANAQESGHAGAEDFEGYDQALFGGPGAALFGSGPYEDDPRADASSGGGRFGQGPPSVSMPSVAQSMMPMAQSDNGPAQQPGPMSGQQPGGQPPHSGVFGPSGGAGQPPEVSMGTGPGAMSPVNEYEPSPDELADSGGSLVRPYARTRGRTRTDYDLAIETLVTTSENGRAQNTPVKPEHRTISDLCVQARSVAEVSAHLRLPLGVVRVLIGDMAGLGLVLIHDGGMVVDDRPSLDFLERVLSGLRRL